MKVRILILSALLSTAAYAQNVVSANASINALATRSINLPPEEAIFNVTIASGSETTLEQVLKALEGTGVTARDLVGVSLTSDPLGLQTRAPRLIYRFRFSAPFSKARETIEKLEGARRSFPAVTELQVNFAAAPSQASIEEARQRVTPELIAEARQKAIFLANAGGVNLGAIESINEQVSLGSIEPTAETTPFFTAERPGTIISLLAGPAQLRVSFTVIVRFSLQ